MVHGCMVYTERAETAAVSCGTSHASAEDTSFRWIPSPRLDYCNCLLMGTSNSVIQPLQKIQNFAARLVHLAPRHHHSTSLLEKLHWLPISERIKYKVAGICFNTTGRFTEAGLHE